MSRDCKNRLKLDVYICKNVIVIVFCCERITNESQGYFIYDIVLIYSELHAWVGGVNCFDRRFFLWI